MRSFLIMILSAVIGVSCATTTAPAATGNNTVATTEKTDAKEDKIRLWTGYFFIEEKKDGGSPIVLIYVGEGDLRTKMGNEEDWIVYQTSPHKENGYDVYAAEIEKPFGFLFNRVVVTIGWPVVEAKIKRCRLSVPVTWIGTDIRAGEHRGHLYKAALADGIKPLSSMEDCEGLIEPAMPE